VVQNSPCLLLDLDIVDYILPTENSSLSLNDTIVDLASLALSDVLGFDGTVVARTRFGIIALLVLEGFGDSSTLKD
jgi:hypothetical protein